MLSHKNKENCNDCGFLRTFTVLLQRTHTQASFPLRGGYLKIKDVRCTWHQKMAIAWDEVVRDWRDMAPGLVFCDTGFLCCAVFFRGTRLHIHPRHHWRVILWKWTKKKQGKRWRLGLVSATRCRAMWPFYRTSSMNVFNTLLGLGWHKHVVFADHSYWLVIETEYFTNY